MFDRYLKPEEYMDGQSVRAPNSLPLEILEPETSRFCLSNWPGNNDAIYFVRLRDGTCQGPNFVDRLKDVNWNWPAFLHVGSRSDMKDVLTAQRFRLREGWVRYHGFPSPEVESLFQNPDVQKVHWVTRGGYLNWVLHSKWDWAFMRGWLDDIVAFKLDHRAVNDSVCAPEPIMSSGAGAMSAENLADTRGRVILRLTEDWNAERIRADKAEEACDMIAKEREAWRERADNEFGIRCTFEKDFQREFAENKCLYEKLQALLKSWKRTEVIPHSDMLSWTVRRAIRDFFRKGLEEVLSPSPNKADADEPSRHYSARTGPVPGPRGGGAVPDHIARKYSKTRDDADRDDD